MHQNSWLCTIANPHSTLSCSFAPSLMNLRSVRPRASPSCSLLYPQHLLHFQAHRMLLDKLIYFSMSQINIEDNLVQIFFLRTEQLRTLEIKDLTRFILKSLFLCLHSPKHNSTQHILTEHQPPTRPAHWAVYQDHSPLKNAQLSD
jgi:hypothetical protein